MAKTATPVLESQAPSPLNSMDNQSTFSAFSEAWSMITSNFNTVMPVVGVLAISTILSFVAGFTENTLLSFFGNIVSLFTTYLALWGFLQIRRGVSTVDLVAKAQDIGSFAEYFITTLVVSVIVLIGLAFLIIPGIYLALRYCFAVLVTIDQKVGVGAALEKSSKMTEGRKLSLLGFGVISMIINIVGAMLFGLGLLLTIPVSLLAFVILYERWKI